MINNTNSYINGGLYQDDAKTLITYLNTLFGKEDLVGYITGGTQPDSNGNLADGNGYCFRTAGDLIASLERHPGNVRATVGGTQGDAGAWICMNPMDGKGMRSGNVTEFRFCLVEPAKLPIQEQEGLFRRLGLPIAALIRSGDSSLLAVVHVDADNYGEYQDRVTFLYNFLKEKGMPVNRKKCNPSCLSRMPGVVWNGGCQHLAATNMGKSSWSEWMDSIGKGPGGSHGTEATSGCTENPQDLTEGNPDSPDTGRDPGTVGKAPDLGCAAMGFPEELKARKQWVAWRLVQGRDGDAKKMPISPSTGKAAKVNDPETWSDYGTAYGAYKKYNYSGIGYVFTKEDGYVGVNIDHCYDPESGSFTETAKAILERQPTYAEFSPSGNGIHLYFRGEKPASRCGKNDETGVEMCDTGRYFTVTEKPLGSAPGTIAADDGTLAWIHEEYISGKKKGGVPVGMSDGELINAAGASKDGPQFMDLLKGKWQGRFKSQYEAAMVFCSILAFWSDKNKEQMDRIFRSSGLLSQKWDEKLNGDEMTYGEKIIGLAIDMARCTYSQSGDDPVYESQGKYWRASEHGSEAITNFILQPVEQVVMEDGMQLTADLVTDKGKKLRHTFMSSDLANQKKFKEMLSGKTIDLSFLGTEKDLQLLKNYISALKWVTRTGVKAMGIHEHNGRLVFVSGTTAVESGGVCVPDIIQIEDHEGIESGILTCAPLGKEGLMGLGKYLMSYNEPAKAVPILAWAAGCFLKEHLRLRDVKFPHLFLIGEAGSGKSTTLEQVLMPIFSGKDITAATQVTEFTLMRQAASSNLIPQVLDEFKPSKMGKFQPSMLCNHFRDSYDGHGGLRGRADQSMVKYDLSAPLIVAGEESAGEPAIRERTVELLFSKKDIHKPECDEAIRYLRSNKEKLSDLGRTLLDTALGIPPEEVREWYDEGYDKFNAEFPDRVKNNLACCYAGLRLLEKACERFSLEFASVFPYGMDTCVKHMELAVKYYTLDGSTHNPGVVEKTLEIMARIPRGPVTYYKVEGDRLYLWLNPFYDVFTKYCREYAVDCERLPSDEFKKRLENSEYFVAKNRQKTLDSQNHKCWVLRYDLLKAKFDVSGFESANNIGSPSGNASVVSFLQKPLKTA